MQTLTSEPTGRPVAVRLPRSSDGWNTVTLNGLILTRFSDRKNAGTFARRVNRVLAEAANATLRVGQHGYYVTLDSPAAWRKLKGFSQLRDAIDYTRAVNAVLGAWRAAAPKEA